MFDYNTTNIQESGDFKPIPAGTYTFRIGEKEVMKTRNGDPLVKVELIVNEGECEGRKIFHYISFLPETSPGAGIAKRWLHAIGEEYEGNITVNPNAWNTVLKADVYVDEYEKNGQKKYSNKISNIHLPKDLKEKIVNKRDGQKNINSDVPF